MKILSIASGLAGIHSRSERDQSHEQFFDSRTILTGLLIFIGYYLGARSGFALIFQPHAVSGLWLRNSIRGP